MDSWKQYQDAHKEEFLAELIDLLKGKNSNEYSNKYEHKK